MKHSPTPDTVTRSVAEWERFAASLFAAAGLAADKAASVARLLVLTDAMGRGTHGLAQCPAYLDELAGGGMSKEGEPEIVRDTGATIVWDGRYLPGLWLMEKALETAFARIEAHGVVTFAMRRSHHIGCLAALAKYATDRGCYIMLASSGPHTKFVAPFGGRQGLFSPDPFAIGFPAGASPVLFDACASLTTVSMTRTKVAAGEQFEHAWLLDSAGRPTRDPAVMEGSGNRGSLMLLGGAEAGHKGFGLALMVEALTQGLSGFGRRDAPTRWGASVFMQVIDPRAFAGPEAFEAQTAFFADQCRANAPIDPAAPVRLPGDQAARNIAMAMEQGIALPRATVAELERWAKRLQLSD
ncbi:Ldh family oxidoreductase [Pseudolabrys sp. Root1462]|uniref:Ldh family oxidoreductase n=1 Tax=Pseudolabrys sp. Root1462 TaxID=1736466 RepID=UPI0009E7FA1F|nr:Ldh family oxidoreductase [Pseudolabrys sp. Root1462]